MQKFEGVANTLFVPLVARINISKRFPEYFMDAKALEMEKYLPDDATKGSSEYSNMASVSRYYNMEYMMQLDKDSGEIEILLDLDAQRTVKLKELIPDWWGTNRFAE